MNTPITSKSNSGYLFFTNTAALPARCRAAWAALVALACVLLSGAATQAQTTNWLFFPLSDAPGSNTTVSSTLYGGQAGVVLTGYSGAGAAVDLHGAIGSGVNGGYNGERAFCLTNGDGGTQPGNAANPPSSASAANCIADLGDAALANTITNFVVSMWFNQPVKAPSGSGFVLPRLFVLSTGGSPGENDGSANSIGVKFQQENEFIFSLNSTTLTTAFGAGNAPTNYPPGDFAINTWYFVAWAYDGTNIYQYTGSASQPATLVNQVSAPGLKVTLGSPSTLVIGNRNFEGQRGFDGWLQDFRFDVGVATNTAAYLEGIRQSSPGVILNVNFTDDAINVDYGGGNAPAPSAAAMSGAAVIGASGDAWNSLHGFTYNPYPDNATYTVGAGTLVYTDGTRSAVTLSLSSPNGSYDNNAVVWNNYSPFSWASLANEQGSVGYPNTPYAPLMATLIGTAANTANASVNLGGLSPNGVYNLYVYSAGNNGAAGRASTFTVGSSTQVSTWDGANTNLVNGVDYLEFAGVTADVNGNLSIGIGNNGASECDFNGFQLQFVSGTLPASTSVPPGITYTTNMNGLTLCTNTSITFTASSIANTITNFSVVTTTSLLGFPVTTVTTNVLNANGTFSGTNVTGINSTPASVTLPLSKNLKYSIAVTATDSTGLTVSATVNFDTFAPALVIEASDYNFSGGSWYETPANGGVWAYYNATTPVVGQATVDFLKTGSEGPGTLFYRDLFTGAPYITEANADTVSEQKFAVATSGTVLGSNDFPALSIGYDTDTPGDWQDYTRTFGPSGYPTDSTSNGTYNVYLFMSIAGGGEDATLSLVTPSPVTASSTQNLTPLGQFGTASFSENDWNGFEYVPMTDSYGNLLAVSIGSGEQTFRLKVGPQGGPNLGFFMLMPATTVPTPFFKSYYPDGSHPFEPTNSFSFVVGTSNGVINSTNIGLVLNGANVTSGLSLTTANGLWTGSYPVLSNEVYVAVVNVTNSAGLSSSLTVNFDTFNVNNYQWEAVDYDFSTNNNTSSPPAQGSEVGPGWISAQFIDNPVPSADVTVTATSGPIGTELTNSYYGYPEDWTSGNDPYGAGAIAQQGIDVNVTANGQTIAYEQYRTGDGVGAQVATDYLRPKFLAAQASLGDTNIGLFNICYFASNNWLNYTRHYPAGSYYLWGRLAYKNNYSSSFGQVTSGVGTTNQTVTTLGAFTDNNATGNQAWHWIPLLDANSNQVVVQTTGQAITYKVTANSEQNLESFMLAPASIAEPVFTVTATIVAGQLNLAFPTVSGHNYSVMYAASLTKPQSWTPVAGQQNIAGTGSVVNVNEPLTSKQGYYTVTVQ